MLNMSAFPALVNSVYKRQGIQEVTSKNSVSLSSPYQTQKLMLSLTSLFVVFSAPHQDAT